MIETLQITLANKKKKSILKKKNISKKNIRLI